MSSARRSTDLGAREYLSALRRRRGIAIATLAAVLYIGLVAAVGPHVYEATAQVRVRNRTAEQSPLPPNLREPILGFEMEAVRSAAVRTVVAHRLGSGASIRPALGSGRDVITMTARSGDGARAAAIASAYADAYAGLRNSGSALAPNPTLRTLTVDEVRRATGADVVAPRPLRYMAVAFVVGAILAIVLALLADRLAGTHDGTHDTGAIADGDDEEAADDRDRGRRGRSQELTKPARVMFYAGMATVPAIAVRPGAGISVSDLCFAASAVLLLAGRRRRAVSTTVAWQIAAWCTLAGAVLATVNADSPGGTLAVEARVLFILVIWLWTARAVLDSDEAVHTAVRAFAVGAAASGAVAVAEVLRPSLFPSMRYQYGRAVALTYHSVDAGAILALACVFGAGMLLYRREQRLVTAALLLVSGVGLVLTGSVSGMLAAVLGGAVVVGRRGLRMRTLGAVALALGAVYLGALIAQARYEGTFTGISPTARVRSVLGIGPHASRTVSERNKSITAGLSEIRRSPVVGHGLDESSTVVYDALPPHNLFVLAWYGGGLLFLVGIALAVGAAVWTGWRRAKDDPTREILFGGTIAMVVFAMTGPIVFHRHVWLPLVLLIAHTARRHHPLRPADVVDPRPHSLARSSSRPRRARRLRSGASPVG